MYYYLVRVASSSYKRDEPLTYAYDQRVKPNSLVAVPIQKKSVIGVVAGVTGKPRFNTRRIMSVLDKTPLPVVFTGFLDWLKTYYPASMGDILLTSLPSSLIAKPRTNTERPGAIRKTSMNLPPLTDEQSQAMKIIQASSDKNFLLHGETGSGKTRLYLECAQKSLDNGKSVLIMTPEIGLTPQLIRTFEEVFGKSCVVTLHSMLTSSERRNVWLRILHSHDPLVIIGPRSAMFTPVKTLGLVVMDEAHDNAYKQEQTPYYQTSRAAAKLANLHGAQFIMGTATPLIADYYTYKQKSLPIIRLSSLAIKDADLPEVQTVRLNDRNKFRRSAYISEPMLRSVEKALADQEQSLIFLNRRGSARVILCQKCSWQATCPNCDLPLVYHGDEHAMRCHVCGYTKPAANNCPECGHFDITFRSIGTKMVTDELKRIFPEAKVQRFDKDNNKNERLENTYESIRLGTIDILVGTQVLGKGLDLPKLSVVGVVQADTSLLIPDYTADEATYQQLVQIIGRVGRGHRKGTVIIQSHEPESPAIQAAIGRNYEVFYQNQLKQRQLFGFPPFYYLLKLTCHRAGQKSAENSAQKLKDQLVALNLRIEIAGPSPAFHAKKDNQYYWQLVIKSKQRNRLLEVISHLPSGWSYNIDPSNLL